MRPSQYLSLAILLFNAGILRARAADGEPVNTLTTGEQTAGWCLLWDGKTTTGWRTIGASEFPTNRWVIRDGVLSVRPNPKAESELGLDLITTAKYSDFEFQLDFQLTPGANSGVKYFVRSNLDPTTGKMIRAELTPAIGCEYQILDDERHPDAKAGQAGNRKLGSLYDLIPAPTEKPLKPMGEWNTARIVVHGRHVEHWLNGVKLLAYERATPAFHELVARSKFKHVPGFGDWPDGHLLLQDHGGVVHYRNLKIRSLQRD